MVDFFSDAITLSCQRGLLFLASQAFIKDFYLAGGTALALQLGHRISTDLDWFSASQNLLLPEREAIRSLLSTGGKVEIVAEQDEAMYVNLFEMDISFVYLMTLKRSQCPICLFPSSGRMYALIVKQRRENWRAG